jgi:cyanophycin synthetase
MTSTSGIYIDKISIVPGDTTGPISARSILIDPSIEVALLECARGGLIRAGVAFDVSDVGIVTNVGNDHLGADGIFTIEQLAHCKAIIAKSASPSGHAVLNADNDWTYEMRTLVKSNVVLFSTNPESDRLKQHHVNGGKYITVIGEYITIVEGENKV